MYSDERKKERKKERNERNERRERKNLSYIVAPISCYTGDIVFMPWESQQITGLHLRETRLIINNRKEATSSASTSKI